MKKAFGHIALLTMFIALSCGDSTGPSGPDVSPSTLSVTFTGSTGHSNGPKSICRVNASWTMCTDHGFQSYTLYRSEEPDIQQDPGSAQEIAVITAYNTTVCVDESVSWDTEYFYALKTTDTEGRGVWSNEVSITTPVIDAPTPSVLEMTDMTWETVELQWTPCPETNFQYYRLYRSFFPDIQSDSSSAECIAIFDWKNDTTFSDTSALSSSTYYYTVLTTNTENLSSWSNEVEVNTYDAVPTTVVAEVSVGTEPWDAVSLPSGDYVYVTDRAEDAVHVIRTSDYSLVKTISIGSTPYGICTSPGGDYVYTANWGSDDVSVVRTSDNTLIRTVSVGERPVDVCILPSGEYLYVTCRDDDCAVVIRTSDNTPVDTVGVGTSPYRLCSDPDGDHVFISNFTSNDVSVVRTSDNTVITAVDQHPHPIGITCLPSGEYVYSSNYNWDLVSVMRTSDYSVTETISVGNGPWGMCAHPSGGCVYVANSIDDTVSLIRTEDNSVAIVLDVGSDPSSICCTSEGDAAYVVNYGSGTVSVLN